MIATLEPEGATMRRAGTLGPSTQAFIKDGHFIRVLLGGRGCLSYDSPIYDPTTGESVAIGERAKHAESFHVLSATVRGVQICQALPPFCKGVDHLLTVTTESGKAFRCASEHKLLTPLGWRPVSQLAPGQLVACSDNPVPTSSDTFHEASRPSALHLMRIARDYLGDCSTDHRPDGEPLHFSPTRDPAFLPSRADACGHTRYDLHEDGLGTSPTGIHAYRPLTLPAKTHSVPFSGLCLAEVGEVTWVDAEGFPILSALAARTRLRLQPTWLHPTCSTGFDTDELQSHDPERLICACDHAIRWERIASIIKDESASAYYDFTVPASGNYWAMGAYHHNSGKTRAVAEDVTRHIWRNAGAKAIIARETEVSQADSSIDTFKAFFETLGNAYSEEFGLFKSWNNGRTFRLPSKLAIDRMQAECGKMTPPQINAWIESTGDKLCGYLEFRGLPAPEKGKFRGMECSYLALIEADQIVERQYQLALACLRWKGSDADKCDDKGFIKDRCVVLDSNPPSPSHWIAQFEEREKLKPEDERTARFWHITTYENEHNLPENYIRDTILTPYAGNAAMIARMLMGEYADAYDGEPVYYAYNPAVHEAISLGWLNGATLIVGMDVGTTNASTISAMKEHRGHTYWWVMREIILNGSDTDRQCVELLKVLANEFPWWNKSLPVCPQTLFFCDPAARNSAFTSRGPNSSALKVMHSHGIFPGMKTAVHLQPSIAVVNRLLQQNHANEKGDTVFHFKIDTKRCPQLTRAMRGGYSYPKLGQAGFGSDQPLKGQYCDNLDHPCFIAGTLITTQRGDIPIESVAVGDMALTRRGWNEVTKAGMSQRNAEVWTAITGMVGRKRITGTFDHPIWTHSGMKKLGVLDHQDLLLSLDGTKEGMKEMVAAPSIREGSADVYNLTVDGEHEYFANGILVGNCDAFRYSVINALDIARETYDPARTTVERVNSFAEPKRTI